MAESLSSRPWAILLPAKPQIPEIRIFIPACSCSLAAWFDSGSSGQVGRQIIRFEGFHVHFDQADKRTAKIGPLPAASIHDYANGGNNPAARAHNIECFLHPSAPGHDIFGHD